jgi:hypothetical protein
VVAKTKKKIEEDCIEWLWKNFAVLIVADYQSEKYLMKKQSQHNWHID